VLESSFYFSMDTFSRRQILGAAVASPAAFLLPSNLPAAEERFQIGIQEYTFNRWLKSGQLDHLDYPALVKKSLGLRTSSTGIGLSRQHTDKLT